MTAQRLLPDPVPQCGGVLTASELESCKRVLRAFEHRRQTLVVTDFSGEEQRMYAALWIAGYLFEYQKTTRSFYWTEAQISDAGRLWLAQISETKS